MYLSVTSTRLAFDRSPHVIVCNRLISIQAVGEGAYDDNFTISSLIVFMLMSVYPSIVCILYVVKDILCDVKSVC